MKIAIEAQRIFRTNKHGMDFVALEAIRHLQKIDTQNEYYILVSPGEDHCLQESPNFKIVEIKCPSYPLWEQVALPLAVRKIQPDILHCTSNTAPIFCSAPLMITLHDIIFLEPRSGASSSMYQNMGWYYRRFVVPKILKKCRKIITVSHFECNRIRESLKIDPTVIKAIYNGYSSHFRPVENPYDTTKKYLAESDYIFFLGNTDPKKNTARTLIAYSQYLEKSDRKLPLLIADIKQEAVEVLLVENKIEHIKPYIRYSGYIVNTDLPAIYSGATMFLYTSLRESFGIPLLEGMACGTPVITSNTSSMPEVGGEGVLMIDPMQATEISKTMLELETSEELREKQIEYGLQRVKEFSWAHTAGELLSTYNQVVEESKKI